MIDARGLSCPLPVIMVQKEVAKTAPSELVVMVDAKVCVENVSRFAASCGYAVTVEETDGEFKMILKK